MTPEKASISAIEIMKESLMRCRHTTKKPDELEWELRVYEFMLLNPVNRLADYMKVRNRDGGYPHLVPKRQVVQELGWEIK